MLENRIKSILHNLNSFGKLNAILYFKILQADFEVICKDVVSQFNPDEIRCSLFDLENMEMIDIEFAVFSNQHSNSILRIILLNEKEEIIMEYYQGQIIVEHIFRPSDIYIVRGHSIIEKYQKEEKSSSVLMIGYELSININSYEFSLNDNITDKSLHPIFVVKNDSDNNSLFERYDSVSGDISDQKKEVMREYLKLIGITSIGW